MNIQSIFNRLLMRDPNMQPHQCFAQDGEDLILNRLLDGQPIGYYVDIGAHHPARFSNTFLFYKRGWQGINIDAMPGSMKKFNTIRPRDINIECGVAAQSGTLAYHRFNEPALNTFDPIEASRKNITPYQLIDTIEVSVQRLDELLDMYLPAKQVIDFMSVDVEGKDEEVLRSNDWVRYRPRFILAETLRTDMMNLNRCSIVSFLSSVGYIPIAKAYNTCFFECVTLNGK